jgi:hypothetical protein
MINLDSYNSGGSDNSLMLWRAYLNVEYAILVLKLTFNINNNYNDEIQSPAKPKKRNLKDAIEIKTLLKPQGNIHVIKRQIYSSISEFSK